MKPDQNDIGKVNIYRTTAHNAPTTAKRNHRLGAAWLTVSRNAGPAHSASTKSAANVKIKFAREASSLSRW